MIHLKSLVKTAERSEIETTSEYGECGSSSRQETVLIIEDDATMRLALGCMLATEHRQVVLAHSADDALERFASINPDIVLCDYLLEGTNGRQFCEKLRSIPRWRFVPIIMVTRLDEELVLTDLLRSGADDVLIKPVRAETLRARIQCGLRTRAKYVELGHAVMASRRSFLSVTA